MSWFGPRPVHQSQWSRWTAHFHRHNDCQNQDLTPEGKQFSKKQDIYRHIKTGISKRVRFDLKSEPKTTETNDAREGNRWEEEALTLSWICELWNLLLIQTWRRIKKTVLNGLFVPVFLHRTNINTEKNCLFEDRLQKLLSCGRHAGSFSWPHTDSDTERSHEMTKPWWTIPWKNMTPPPTVSNCMDSISLFSSSCQVFFPTQLQ